MVEEREMLISGVMPLDRWENWCAAQGTGLALAWGMPSSAVVTGKADAHHSTDADGGEWVGVG